MKQSEEEPIVYKVQLLEELAMKQSNLLKVADELINLKTRLIEVCEEETEHYRQENKRLRKLLFVSSIVLAINVAINVIHLLS